jgi:hypothetical protein
MATAPASLTLYNFRRRMSGPYACRTALSGHLQSTIAKPHGLQDQDGDGKISFEEFAMLIANTDLENKMTIPF